MVMSDPGRKKGDGTYPSSLQGVPHCSAASKLLPVQSIERLSDIHEYCARNSGKARSPG